MKSTEYPRFEEPIETKNLKVSDDIFLIIDNIRVVIFERTDGLFMVRRFKWVHEDKDTKQRYSYWHDIDATSNLYDSARAARESVFR